MSNKVTIFGMLCVILINITAYGNTNYDPFAPPPPPEPTVMKAKIAFDIFGTQSDDLWEEELPAPTGDPIEGSVEQPTVTTTATTTEPVYETVWELQQVCDPVTGTCTYRRQPVRRLVKAATRAVQAVIAPNVQNYPQTGFLPLQTQYGLCTTYPTGSVVSSYATPWQTVSATPLVTSYSYPTSYSYAYTTFTEPLEVVPMASTYVSANCDRCNRNAVFTNGRYNVRATRRQAWNSGDRRFINRPGLFGWRWNR